MIDFKITAFKSGPVSEMIRRYKLHSVSLCISLQIICMAEYLRAY